jgi:hypothetical protein
LPFGSVDWETPFGTYSVSSISHSTSSPRQCSTVATDLPPAAKRVKRTPNANEGKGSSLYDTDDGGDKYDNEDDFIPATNGPILTTAQDAADDMFIAEKAAELIEKHRQEFMKRAFSVRTLASDVPLTTASASIKMCRPQKDIDYIIYVLNWRVGVNIKVIDPCPERDSISKFRRANHNGAKYAKQYVLEEIVVPGSNMPHTVLRDTCPIEEALQSVCNLVLEGKYNSTDQQRISYSKYHEIEIGSSSPVKKGKGCSCKKGCGKNYGCKKKGMRCHSGCFYNGNCCDKGM